MKPTIISVINNMVNLRFYGKVLGDGVIRAYLARFGYTRNPRILVDKIFLPEDHGIQPTPNRYT
jgi:hypothetical protein